jgi:hypothetical protein
MAKKPPPKLRVVPDTDGSGPGFAPPDDVQKLAYEKLLASGITPDQAKALGITWHSATEASMWGFENLPILRIPYFVADNSRAPLRPRPDWPEFLRVRYLRPPSPLPDGWGKYSQPKQTGVAGYFPRWGEIDWEEVRANWETEIIITEGELKSCASVIHTKIPTIGLGGIWNFRSIGADTGFLPELKGFTWARRRVTIIYDSDMMDPTKAAIRQALQELGEELVKRGALPQYLVLPDLLNGQGKTGLDDYLVAKGASHVREAIAKNSMSFCLSEPLWDMNTRYAVVRRPVCIACVGSPDPIKTEHLKIIEASAYDHRAFRPNGTPFLESMQAAEYWIKWPLRNQVARLTYDPSAAPLAITEDGQEYNTWSGWGCEPKPGDVSPFIKLLDHVFAGAKEEERLWFLRWCAYPIKHPGTKMFSSAVIHGLAQGTGKSLLGYSVRAIYGSNFAEISQDDLHAPFNEWAVHKQFVMGDDVTGSDKRKDLDRLKKMVTQREIRLNVKNVASYVVPDLLNFYFTSNHADAFFLEDQDRRFFIHEVRSKPIPEAFGPDWGRSYRKWLEEEGGGAALHAYFKALDMGDFDPAGPALATSAKEHMRRESRSDIGNWCRDLRDNPDEMLVVGSAMNASGTDPRLYGDLFSCFQILEAYKYFAGADADRITGNRMGRELVKSGFRQVRDGVMVHITGRKPERYYAIKNAAFWESATLAEVKAHIENPPKPGEGPQAGSQAGGKKKKF